jgi:hypothetical protein
MFNNCYNLISIDFPNLDIDFTKDYNQIFLNCEHLQYLNLSNLKGKHISDCSYMFNNLNNLISID